MCRVYAFESAFSGGAYLQPHVSTAQRPYLGRTAYSHEVVGKQSHREGFALGCWLRMSRAQCLQSP